MIEQELRTAILADSTLSSLLPENAVYPGMLPQGAPKPCVTYEYHDTFGNLQLGGPSDIDRATVTFKVYGEQYGSTRAVARALMTFLHGTAMTVGADTILLGQVQNVFNDYEDTLELYSSTIDFTMLIKEA